MADEPRLRRLLSDYEVDDAPFYDHDCADCTFLGRLLGHDLYYCTQGGICPTIIARFGNDGPDYTSGGAVTLQQPGGRLRLDLQLGRPA